jgi:hypothetical protein
MSEVIQIYKVRTKLRIHLNSDPNSSWSFYDTGDPSTLNPDLGSMRSLVRLTSEDGSHYWENDSAFVPDGSGYIKSGEYYTLDISKKYFVDLYDYQSRRWRAGDPNTPEGRHLITVLFNNNDIVNTEVYEETFGNNTYRYTIYTLNNNAPIVVEAFPLPDPPTLQEFIDLTMNVNFHKLEGDSAHSSAWASAANNGDPYWMHAQRWGIQWQNIQDGFNGSILHPSVNLYFCVAGDGEHLSAREIYERSRQLQDGYGDYRTFAALGMSYTPGGGSVNNGYFVVDLQQSYIPQGIPSGGGFKDKGSLHWTMGMDGVDFAYWKTGNLPVRYEPEIASGSLSVSVDRIGSNKATLLVSGFITDPSAAVSPITTHYRVNGGDWQSVAGYQSMLEVSGLTPNASNSIDVKVSYMNGDSDSSSDSTSVRTLPGIDKINYQLTPKPQEDGSILYDLLLSADHSNSGSVRFAFFSDLFQRDYDQVDLSTDNQIQHLVNYQSSASHTYIDLSESDLEQHYWVIAVRDATQTALMNWSSVYMTTSAISGLQSDSPLSDDPVMVTIPSDSSNRLFRQVTVRNVDVGITRFAQQHSVVRNYEFPAAVASLILEAEDERPAGTNIEYLLHFNQQSYPITPINRTGDAPHIYHINLPVPEDERQIRQNYGEAFIDTNGNARRVTLEIKLTGNASDDQLTPIVYKVKLQGIAHERRSVFLNNSKFQQVWAQTDDIS